MAPSHLDYSMELHKNSKHYGASDSYTSKTEVKQLYNIPKAINDLNKNKTKITSILDYGTGKGGLIQILKHQINSTVEIKGYDPAVKEFAETPKKKFDIITCIEVLEHVDRDSIDETLSQISNLTKKFFFYAIDLIPANKKLSDGRNAHILLAPPDWWIQQITSKFSMNVCFQLGRLPDKSPYPLRLVGCATNKHLAFDDAVEFLNATGLTERDWLLAKKQKV